MDAYPHSTDSIEVSEHDSPNIVIVEGMEHQIVVAAGEGHSSSNSESVDISHVLHFGQEGISKGEVVSVIIPPENQQAYTDMVASVEDEQSTEDAQSASAEEPSCQQHSLDRVDQLRNEARDEDPSSPINVTDVPEASTVKVDMEDAVDVSSERDKFDINLTITSTAFAFCPICGEKMNTTFDIRDHCKSCIKKFKFVNVTSADGQSVGVKKRLKKYICGTCSQKFANKGAFEKHRFFCDSNALLSDFVNASQEIEEPSTKSEPVNAVKKETEDQKGIVSRVHSCPECNKTFSSANYVKTHLRIHTGEKPNKCDTCSRTFNDRTALRNHIKSHSNERPYACTKCDKRFRRSDSLKYHMTSHTGNRPFICHKCAKSFKTDRDLRAHERAIHDKETADKKNQQTVCSECNQAFPTYNAYKYHRRLMHSTGKNLVCEFCQKTFLARSQLNIHIRSHTGEKPYKCSHCDKSFRRPSHLSLHENRHTGQKVFRCHLCHKGFPQKGELVQHEKIHSGAKPFCCAHCHKCFAREDYLRVHIKAHERAAASVNGSPMNATITVENALKEEAEGSETMIVSEDGTFYHVEVPHGEGIEAGDGEFLVVATSPILVNQMKLSNTLQSVQTSSGEQVQLQFQ